MAQLLNPGWARLLRCWHAHPAVQLSQPLVLGELRGCPMSVTRRSFLVISHGRKVQLPDRPVRQRCAGFL